MKTNFNRTFTIDRKANHWNDLVGRFTDRLNTIADGFLMNKKTHYPNGVKIRKYNYPEIAKDLANYCKAMKCKTKDDRGSCLEELWSLCSSSEIGFTKKYWWTMGYGKKVEK